MYGFLDAQGGLISRCCGYLSPVNGMGSKAYSEWSHFHMLYDTARLLALPQCECSEMAAELYVWL